MAKELSRNPEGAEILSYSWGASSGSFTLSRLSLTTRIQISVLFLKMMEIKRKIDEFCFFRFVLFP